MDAVDGSGQASGRQAGQAGEVEARVAKQGLRPHERVDPGDDLRVPIGVPVGVDIGAGFRRGRLGPLCRRPGGSGDGCGKSEGEKLQSRGEPDDGRGVLTARPFEIQGDEGVDCRRGNQHGGGNLESAVSRHHALEAGAAKSVRSSSRQPHQTRRVADIDRDQGKVDRRPPEQDEQAQKCRRQGMEPHPAAAALGVGLRQALKADEDEGRHRGRQDRGDELDRLDVIAPAQSDQRRLDGTDPDQHDDGTAGRNLGAAACDLDEKDQQEKGNDKGDRHGRHGRGDPIEDSGGDDGLNRDRGRPGT